MSKQLIDWPTLVLSGSATIASVVAIGLFIATTGGFVRLGGFDRTGGSARTGSFSRSHQRNLQIAALVFYIVAWTLIALAMMSRHWRSTWRNVVIALAVFAFVFSTVYPFQSDGWALALGIVGIVALVFVLTWGYAPNLGRFVSVTFSLATILIGFILLRFNDRYGLGAIFFILGWLALSMSLSFTPFNDLGGLTFVAV